MKIHCVWTRDLDVPHSAGRLRIARSIRDTLDQLGETTHHVMSTILELKRLQDFAQAAWNGSRHRLPMQCWLFDTARNRQIADAIPADADVVYLDGIRTIHMVQRLRERLPHARLIVDLDDLMSRRTEELIRLGEGFSAGYLADKMPRWGRSLEGPGLRYERDALRRWEDRLCQMADDLVLLSPVEAAMLDRRPIPRRRARIHWVLPPQEIVREPVSVVPPLRFTFIGTDGLTQNRLTIAHLLDLWRRLAPPVPLHIFGRMTKRWEAPANVFFHGYVDDLAAVYDDHSILIAPALLRGGVKTKVLEAFAWGTPVIGNEIAFDGLALRDYPLAAAPEELVRSINSPATHRQLDAAARIGNDYVRASHDPGVFSAAWRDIVSARAVTPAYAAD